MDGTKTTPKLETKTERRLITMISRTRARVQVWHGEAGAAPEQVRGEEAEEPRERDRHHLHGPTP
jgi:hypothetical protein